MRLIVLIHAACGEDSTMDICLEAGVCQVKRTDGVGPHRLRLILFTPVDVGSASASSSVEDVGWFGQEELRKDSLSIFHADRRGVDFFSLFLQEALQMPSNPSVASPYEKARLTMAICLAACHCDESADCVV